MNKLLVIATCAAALLFLASCKSNDSTTQYRVTLSASPSDGGSVSPADGQYDEGTSLDISATPNANWRFDHWEGDFSGTSPTATVVVNIDKRITGVFKKKSYELQVTTQGQGTVDEQVVTPKAKEYEHGTVVELTATPDPGWGFKEWQGDATGSENPVQITVDQAKAVTAVFENQSFALSISTTGQGVVAKNPDQPAYQYGSMVELSAMPTTGWGFKEWQGDATGSENPVQITVDQAKTVTAVFGKFYLAANGVTIQCEAANVGDTGVVNGVTYTKRIASQITPGNAETTCTSGITDMSNMFKGASSFNGDLSSWDVSAVTDMADMFATATSFDGDLSSWDVSSVTDMNGMFGGATSFNGDLSGWDVSSVTDMSGMFSATSFNGDISSWDVSSVTDMSGMFSNAISFNGDISGWDVSSVTNMDGMFGSASSFNGDLSSWDVSSVTSMHSMFFRAGSFNSDISGWDVSGVTNMDNMFDSATSFSGDISSWDVSSVTSMHSMFFGASSFNSDISGWDVSSVTNMAYMFYQASSFNQDLSGWCVTNITSEPQNFSGGSALTGVHKPVWGTCPGP